MDKGSVLERLDRLTRLMQRGAKPYLSAYVDSQADRLRRIMGGRPYVLCTYYIPSELTCLYDAEFLYIDRTVGLAASAGLLPRTGEDLGPLCSYQQAFFDLLSAQILPPPELLLCMEYPCADAGRLMQAVESHFGVEMLRISRKNMQEDFMHVVRELDRRYQRKEKAETVASRYQQANAWKARVDHLRLAYPGIADSADFFKLFTIENDFGSLEAVGILHLLYQDLSKRVKSWRLPSGKRLVWLGLIPLYDLGLVTRLYAQTGFWVAWEEMWMFERPDCHTEDFFTGMAERLRQSLFFDEDVRAQRLIERAEQLKADVVVHFSQRRCSFLPPAIPKLKARLEEMGILWMGAGGDVVRRGKFDDGRLFDALRDGKAGEPPCQEER